MVAAVVAKSSAAAVAKATVVIVVVVVILLLPVGNFHSKSYRIPHEPTQAAPSGSSLRRQ